MKIHEDAQSVVRHTLVQIRELQAGLNNFLNGIRIGMGLGGEYTFDHSTMEFKEKPDGATADKPE